MRNTIFLISLFVIIGCRNENPISGTYKSKDSNINAVVLDSSLFLMKGIDTLIHYDLRIYKTSYLPKEPTIREYNVLFGHCLCHNGFEDFANPFIFKYDSLRGGSLTCFFFDNDILHIGGYNFKRVKDKDEAEKVFLIWGDLYKNNSDQLEYDEAFKQNQ